MFQIKDFLSIVAGCINHMRSTTSKITDYSVGSVARTLIEGPAIEIDQLYQQMLAGLREAIPVSVYNSFSFPPLPALPATGLITVTITAQTAPVLISGGTSFLQVQGNNAYASIADVTIAAGATTANISVAAAAPGAAGNLAAGSSFNLSQPPAGFVSAVNNAALLGGSDAETAAAQQTRFAAYILSLARSTVPGLIYALTSAQILDVNGNITERIATAYVDEPYERDATQPVGLVNCYVHNGVGNTSSAIVALAKQTVLGYTNAAGKPVPGYKAAGTHVTVAAATEQAVNVTGTVTLGPGSDPNATPLAAQQAVFAYIQGIPIGSNFLLAEAIALVMAVPGVVNFSMTAPTADVVGAFNIKLVPGTVSIT